MCQSGLYGDYRSTAATGEEDVQRGVFCAIKSFDPELYRPTFLHELIVFIFLCSCKDECSCILKIP